MDPSGDGGGGLAATGLFCGSCGSQLSAAAKFCSECGAPLAHPTRSAEYKQVTVLFADVVHSMDIAAAVGPERLREIMTELVNRCTAVVQHFGGTVDKFTGDGIMAVFGAPVALEDHAVRACLAALGVQQEVKRLAVDVQERDEIDLQLRVGLNSGQVIAGEIGSGPLGYTAVGEQVGMAQRMESVAPPGGVMLSASTARLVEGAATLGESELVRIKGADEGVPARRLLGIGDQHRAVRHTGWNLVGRRWELSAIESLLDRAVDGHGGVVGVVGPPGIGKSRLVREVSAMAATRGVEVFTAFCESHTSQLPFHAVARLLRAATGAEGLDGQAARDRVRARVPDADPEDLLLFDDLLGIADPEVVLPTIDPDARRRRLTALINAASLARETPAVYVVEDAHWIDEVSESLLADFLTVIPQTPSLVLATYRPEYEGALARVHGAQTIALAPLSDSESAALITELLGPHPTVDKVGQKIADRAAGNPFFAEEMVRDLVERGVLRGERGAYLAVASGAEVTIPATLQAVIAARIDRLDPKAKRTLSAASVLGSRFGLDLLTVLGVEPVVADLVAAQLIDQVSFTRQPEYVFHHPLIRTVAYEAQLKSDRAEMHRRVAAAIEQREPDSVDENAALIAEHLEGAGDLRAAYAWHMRAGAWSTARDAVAARTSWQRARHVADRLPTEEPDRASMRIAPRMLLCASAWRVGGSVEDTRFGELRALATAADDKLSLAVGMAGMLMILDFRGRYLEAARATSEYIKLVDSIDDPTIIIAMSVGPLNTLIEVGEVGETLRLAQRVIDLADGDPTKANLIVGSPLALALMCRGTARYMAGLPGWQEDLEAAIAMARSNDLTSWTGTGLFKCAAVVHGALLPDAMDLTTTTEMLDYAEVSGDNMCLGAALWCHGLNLVHQGGDSERPRGLALLGRARELAVQQRFTMTAALVAEIETAREKARLGELNDAIELLRTIVDHMFQSHLMTWLSYGTRVFVELLLQRGGKHDLDEVENTVNRLTTATSDSEIILFDLTLLRLRALLARARGDEAGYRDNRDRYRGMAKSLGFEGHMKWAEAMP